MSIKHELKYCGRCNAQFDCRQEDITSCQCSTLSVSETTIDFLSGTSYDCLCANCLTELENKISNNSSTTKIL